jgi:hypothetical protein
MSTTAPLRSELAATFKSVSLDDGGGDVIPRDSADEILVAPL